MNQTSRRAAEKSLGKRGYALGELLGRGAFSGVYLVEKGRTGSRAACKISENTALLFREAELLADLRHPLFPEVYEHWQESGLGYLLMEEISGKNLGEWMRLGRKFSAGQIAETGMELAEGLLYLHERQEPVLFRDVKPENIMLREDGRIKLLDFGCAWEPGSGGGSRAGTPGYGAPEQFEESGRQTLLCDVYGLGRTLQAMADAGQPLTEGLWERLRERGERRRLENVLVVCAKEEPSARPADMRVVMAALFPLCAGAAGRRSWGSWGGDFWKEGVVCRKNIWKSTYKTT